MTIAIIQYNGITPKAFKQIVTFATNYCIITSFSDIPIPNIIVSIFAMILAAALSIPMTNLCISPIFGMMGASKITYAIKPLEIFLLYPGIIVITTLIVAFLTSLSTRSIKSSDTANIE